MSRNLKVALIIGGIVLAVLVSVPFLWGVFGGWRSGGWGGMMGPGMMGFGLGWLMMIPMVLFWVFVVLGIVWLVRRSGGCCAPQHPERQDQSGSALEILKIRYARGEISKEEFEARKRDLL